NSRQGRSLAHEPEGPWRGGSHRQGQGGFPPHHRAFEGTRLSRRGHHRTRNFWPATNGRCSRREGLSGKADRVVMAASPFPGKVGGISGNASNACTRRQEATCQTIPGIK